jgi:hypothetical protein
MGSLMEFSITHHPSLTLISTCPLGQSSVKGKWMGARPWLGTALSHQGFPVWLCCWPALSYGVLGWFPIHMLGSSFADSACLSQVADLKSSMHKVACVELWSCRSGHTTAVFPPLWTSKVLKTFAPLPGDTPLKWFCIHYLPTGPVSEPRGAPD